MHRFHGSAVARLQYGRIPFRQKRKTFVRCYVTKPSILLRPRAPKSRFPVRVRGNQPYIGMGVIGTSPKRVDGERILTRLR
jgi:hypothetical protein